MKIIDLLNKIANGEEVPSEIKFNGFIWNYDIYNKRYCKGKNLLFNVLGHYKGIILNDEVEILEEENKIPEKLDVISWDKCIHNATHKEKELAIEINKTQELLNQVIDYLKSKGD